MGAADDLDAAKNLADKMATSTRVSPCRCWCWCRHTLAVQAAAEGGNETQWVCCLVRDGGTPDCVCPVKSGPPIQSWLDGKPKVKDCLPRSVFPSSLPSEPVSKDFLSLSLSLCHIYRRWRSGVNNAFFSFLLLLLISAVGWSKYLCSFWPTAAPLFHISCSKQKRASGGGKKRRRRGGEGWVNGQTHMHL